MEQDPSSGCQLTGCGYWQSIHKHQLLSAEQRWEKPYPVTLQTVPQILAQRGWHHFPITLRCGQAGPLKKPGLVLCEVPLPSCSVAYGGCVEAGLWQLIKRVFLPLRSGAASIRGLQREVSLASPVLGLTQWPGGALSGGSRGSCL